MQNLTYEEIFEFINANILQPFYELRLKRLNELKLHNVLQRKNPYLFKAKNISTAQDYVIQILQAHLSSQEETIFGGYLEQLARFICGRVYGGFKSSADGIDLEFEKDSVRYIVAIKSGPYWANSQQIARMRSNFQKAKRVLGTNSSKTNIIAVNGCCYGRDNNPDKGDYVKYCGQEFWSFISGDDQLYMRIIEPLDEEASQKDEDFKAAYSKAVNLLTHQFLDEFCSEGIIDWVKLLSFVSSKSMSQKVLAKEKHKTAIKTTRKKNVRER